MLLGLLAFASKHIFWTEVVGFGAFRAEWWSMVEWGGGGWGVGGGCELVRGVEEEALAKTWGQGGLTQSPSVGPWLGLSALKFWEMPSS